MQIETTHTFPAPPSLVADMMLDKGFWEAVAERAEATSHQVLISHGVAELVIAVPAPKAMAALVGGSLTLTQRSALGAPNDLGERSADVDVAVAGLPVVMKAKGRLSATEGGTELHYSGELNVRIPILGRRIETEALPFIEHALDSQAEVARDWLARSQSDPR